MQCYSRCVTLFPYKNVEALYHVLTPTICSGFSAVVAYVMQISCTVRLDCDSVVGDTELLVRDWMMQQICTPSCK